MTFSGCVYALKTAIFLNNAAVNMMHRGGYDEAFATLKNGLGLMRVIALATQSGHFEAEIFSGREIEELSKLRVKLTHEKIFASKARKPTNDVFGFQTISSLQDPADFCCLSNSRTKYCFIVIEESDSEESEQILNDEIELCSNLMVYNFGLAHCIYPVNGILANHEQSCIQELRERGFYLLSTCEKLFNARLRRDDPLHFQQNTVLLASVLLTQAQIQLCRELFHAAEMSHYYVEALQTLLLAIKVYKEFLPILPNFAAGAA
jgi:hypothetical protein